MAPLSMSRAVTVAALLVCGGCGGYCVTVTGLHSGLFTAIEAAASRAAGPYIPGGPAPFRTSYTGIAGVDRYLSGLVTFFALIVDGPQTWATTLAFWYLMTQLCAGWCLIALEGRRQGNRGRFTSWTTAVGFVFQNITYTVAVPLYLVLHVLTSPIAADTFPSAASPAGPASHVVAVDPLDSAILPLSTVLAYSIPGVIAVLPSPGLVAPLSHYAWNAIWQVFPAIQSLYHRFLRIVLQSSFSSSPSSSRQAGKAVRMTAPAATYRYILFISLLSQMLLLIVAITPAGALPKMWAPVFDDVNLVSAFVPSWPRSSSIGGVGVDAAMSAPHYLAESVKRFLQWDIYCGGTAVLVWAVFLRSLTRPGIVNMLSVLPKVAFWTVCGGPPAAAAILLWERDEEAAFKEKRGKAQ